MATFFYFTPSGQSKFDKFFDKFAAYDTDKDSVWLEALDRLQDQYKEGGETLSYELKARFTSTERPELLHLDPEDVAIEFGEYE